MQEHATINELQSKLQIWKHLHRKQGEKIHDSFQQDLIRRKKKEFSQQTQMGNATAQ